MSLEGIQLSVVNQWRFPNTEYEGSMGILVDIDCEESTGFLKYVSNMLCHRKSVSFLRAHCSTINQPH